MTGRRTGVAAPLLTARILEASCEGLPACLTLRKISGWWVCFHAPQSRPQLRLRRPMCADVLAQRRGGIPRRRLVTAICAVISLVRPAVRCASKDLGRTIAKPRAGFAARALSIRRP